MNSPARISNMVLHCEKTTKKMKEVNAQAMLKKKDSGVKRSNGSKKECSKNAIPLCRSINTLSSRNSKATEQVGFDELVPTVDKQTGFF